MCSRRLMGLNNIMKKFLMAFFLILTLSASGCSRGQEGIKPAEEDKLIVAATIFPLYDIVRQVGGGRADVRLILAPGASPHTFEATPGLVRDLAGARAVFMIGAGLDDWAAEAAQAAGNAALIDLHEEAAIRPYADFGHGLDEEHGVENENEDEHEEDGHEHGQYDPHYWLDPAIAADMARAVARHLSELDPDSASEYEQNAEMFAAEVSVRARGWQERLSGLEDRKLIVFHDAWNYFADHFGLEIAASFEPFPGRAPSPRYLADLIAAAREHDVKALFVEPQLSRQAMDDLAADLGLDVRVLDPLGGVPGRESYIELMEYNVAEVYEALDRAE